MNKPKHTPGRWKFVAPSFIGTDDPDTQTIGYVETFVASLSDHRNNKPRPKDETNANGHLLAAAPDLQAAVSLLLEELKATELHYSAGASVRKACDAGRAALVKSKGKAP